MYSEGQSESVGRHMILYANVRWRCCQPHPTAQTLQGTSPISHRLCDISSWTSTTPIHKANSGAKWLWATLTLRGAGEKGPDCLAIGGRGAFCRMACRRFNTRSAAYGHKKNDVIHLQLLWEEEKQGYWSSPSPACSARICRTSAKMDSFFCSVKHRGNHWKQEGNCLQRTGWRHLIQLKLLPHRLKDYTATTLISGGTSLMLTYWNSVCKVSCSCANAAVVTKGILANFPKTSRSALYWCHWGKCCELCQASGARARWAACRLPGPHTAHLQCMPQVQGSGSPLSGTQLLQAAPLLLQYQQILEHTAASSTPCKLLS